MNEFPLVSIIIISYMHEDYIDDCMKSLLEISYPNMELFYLDDYSQDETYKNALVYKERLEQKYKNVFWECNEMNQGLIHNLNKLIPKCTGKYVKFLAADDFMLEKSIELMVDYMEKYTEYDMMYTNALYGNKSIRYPIISEGELPLLYQNEPPVGKDLFEKLYERDFIAAPTVMIKGEVYKRLGLYDTNLGIEDWDYFLRIAKQGSIGYLNQVTVMYRFTDDSLSHSSNPARRMNMKKSELLILEKYKEYVQDNGEVRIEKSYNEAISDACHICDAKYMKFLKMYRVRNHVHMTMHNKMKYFLYLIGFFRIKKV